MRTVIRAVLLATMACGAPAQASTYPTWYYPSGPEPYPIYHFGGFITFHPVFGQENSIRIEVSAEGGSVCRGPSGGAGVCGGSSSAIGEGEYVIATLYARALSTGIWRSTDSGPPAGRLLVTDSEGGFAAFAGGDAFILVNSMMLPVKPEGVVSLGPAASSGPMKFGYAGTEYYVHSIDTVPVPAALPLFVSALAGLALIRRARSR